MTNYINLTSNRMIRNAIVFLDFMIALGVIMLAAKYMGWRVYRPNILLVVGILAMTFAQTGFSTTLHHHYVGIDRVMEQTTKLMFTYGLFLYGFCVFIKWVSSSVLAGRFLAELILLTYVFILISRAVEFLLIKWGRKKGRNSRSLTFVGKADRVEEILRDVDSNVASGLRYVGYYAPEESETLSQRMAYQGDYQQLNERLEQNIRCSDEIYCALPPKEKELSRKLIRHCMHNAMHFYYVPTFISDFGEYLKPCMIGEQVVFANFTEPLLDPANRAMKRTFDIVCSGFAILCLLPFLPLIVLCIEIQSPGNPFFGQLRTGLGGKDFMMWKFRSMHANKDADKLQATKDDPRKYPFGNFMRKTSIDELPQLWNILRGDMSIVGPRPHMRKHTEEYSKLIDEYMVRLYIRPGLTGWAQTTGYRGETAELWQMEGRVKRDIWYIQNWTFWLDMRIIIRTIRQVVMHDKQAY